ncbi:MAG: hypothetical protein IPP01_03975 [Saprospiraceae bacterium]|nr:hypothetical protein [Saprospiraceae bacterium]
MILHWFTTENLGKENRYLLPFYSDIMVEEYIAGREFTVLVSADPLSTNDTKSYKPIEYFSRRERI